MTPLRRLKRMAASMAWLSLISAPCAAAEPDIEAALDLADAAPVSSPAGERNWRLVADTAYVSSVSRSAGSSRRVAFALDGDATLQLHQSVLAVASGRFNAADSVSTEMPQQTEALLREGYISWQLDTDRVVDVGRVNVRQGMAIGYNPTDYFKVRAVGAATSPDPDRRRKTRIGSIMARGQQLWSGGAFSFLFSPRLAGDHFSGHSSNSSLSRTNSQNRWQLAGSYQLGNTVRPHWLIYGERGQSPQFGINVSMIPSDSVVLYAEASGGRSASLADMANEDESDSKFRTRSALGLTYTFPIDLSVTLEWQTNGGGISAARQKHLALNEPGIWVRSLQLASARQEALTRQSAFPRLAWRNALLPGIDVSGIFLRDIDDGGRQMWWEIRKHFDRLDVSLQWHRQGGDPWTRFGALEEHRAARILAQFFF
jgi:hypothetical protein